MKKLAEIIDGFRWVILGLGILITLLFAYQVSRLEVETDFEDLYPQNHPYIKVHNTIREEFGGANQVLLMLQVRHGDIFTTETLEKVRYVTQQLRKVPGVDKGKIRSIATRRAKYAEVSSGKIGFVYLMFPDVPKHAKEMAVLRRRIYSSPRYYGPFVSLDSKKTLITVDFYEDKVDYDKIFSALSEIRADVEDDNHILNIAGEPMHFGYLHYHNRDILTILAITVLVVIAFLYCYLKRSVKFVVIPVITSAASAVWGLGFMSLVGYNLDPLVLVLPFLLSLMTTRHAMQFILRYMEEVKKGSTRRQASRTLIEKMFTPGLTGIITDAFGIALVAVAAIPILQKISFTCAFWSLVTVVFSLVFTPILISVLPESVALLRRMRAQGTAAGTRPGLLERSLEKTGAWLVRGGKWAVVVVTVVVVGVSYYYAEQIEVGDFIPGSPILWPSHRYNQDALRITYSMPLLNPIYVVMDAGEGQWSLENADVLKSMDRFQRYVTRHRRVMFVQSIVTQMPKLWSGIRDGDPNYNFLPQEPGNLGYALKGILYRSRPGDWSQFVNHNTSSANIIVYCRDKMPRTLREVMGHIKGFIAKEQLEKGSYLLAGGSLGVQAAVREVIAEAQIWNLSLALFMVFLFCSINFRSFAAGLILAVPLAISNLIAFGLMAAYQIGLTVNTYPVSSVGIGLGVDYGIYFIGRLREEKKTAPDLSTAIVNTLMSNGKSIFIIATTLCIGLLMWLFSNLKFQAEMGALLAILLFLNMLGALLLVPSFVAIFKPKFIMKINKTE